MHKYVIKEKQIYPMKAWKYLVCLPQLGLCRVGGHPEARRKGGPAPCSLRSLPPTPRWPSRNSRVGQGCGGWASPSGANQEVSASISVTRSLLGPGQAWPEHSAQPSGKQPAPPASHRTDDPGAGMWGPPRPWGEDTRWGNLHSRRARRARRGADPILEFARGAGARSGE